VPTSCSNPPGYQRAVDSPRRAGLPLGKNSNLARRLTQPTWRRPEPAYQGPPRQRLGMFKVFSLQTCRRMQEGRPFYVHTKQCPAVRQLAADSVQLPSSSRIPGLAGRCQALQFIDELLGWSLTCIPAAVGAAWPSGLRRNERLHRTDKSYKGGRDRSIPGVRVLTVPVSRPVELLSCRWVKVCVRFEKVAGIRCYVEGIAHLLETRARVKPRDCPGFCTNSGQPGLTLTSRLRT
jgi:hypothetical protein